MADNNPQDGNVGNLGDILKHAALVQLAVLFADHIEGERYYLDSHSYLYQSRLVNPNWQSECLALLGQSALYQDYIELETPYINQGNYLCSSGLINRVIPDAHLLLCESNKFTREWLLQQLADNKVDYHTVKEQLSNWAMRKSFKKLPNLLILIDPFELTDELWSNANKCLTNMLHKQASVIMLVFDFKKTTDREWPAAPRDWVKHAATIASCPYHLAVYASSDLVNSVQSLMEKLGWNIKV